MQVGEVQQVGEDEVTVKTHERTGIECQRQQPTGGRQIEQGIAQCTRIAQRPTQGREPGQGQFGDDPG
ncbi:hypothetical protein D3C87_1237830 [compost metagenome]